MSKKLDFNAWNVPVLELTMMDDTRTVLHVTSSSEKMMEELNEVVPHLTDIQKTPDADSIRAVYDLAARLMSYNRQGVTVTVDDLRGKYKMNLEYLILFFNVYIEYIQEISNAKN